MEILILIPTVMLLLAFVGRARARRRNTSNTLSPNDIGKIVAESKRKQDEADKIITIIFPTINNDKIEK